MVKAARVNVTLTGRHPLAPASVKEACKSIGGMLSGGAIPHTVQSSVPGLDLPGGDGGEHPEHVRAKVEESTFDIRWSARLPADVPDAIVEMVNGCLQIIDEVNVQASVEADRVSMTLPRIGDGPLAHRLTSMAFELEPPKIPQKPPDGHETRFFGMAVSSGKEDGRVVIFAERKSAASDVGKAIEYSLKALSSYCGGVRESTITPGDPRHAREALSMISKLSIKAFRGSNAGHPALRDLDFTTGAATGSAGDRHQVNLDAATMERFFSLVSMIQTSRVRLETFVGFLQDHGILPHALRFSFDQQARLQKCAFIAQRGFELDLGYDYYLHEYGAFSSFVGADFVRIVRGGIVTDGELMPLSFQAKRFVGAVAGREIDWLNVATVVIHETPSCEAAALLSRVEGIAVHYDRRLIRRVLDDLGAALPRPGVPENTGERP